MELGIDYNTQQEDIILREYGRNIQKMAAHVLSQEDGEKRQNMATALVELMKQINPSSSKDALDVTQKVWSHLHIITDFKLDLPNPPFEMPDAKLLNQKPNRVDYHDERMAYRHYGKNTEYLIEQACALEDEEERQSAIIHIGKLMRRFYVTWNKENVDNSVILTQMKKLSDGKLDIDLDMVNEYKLFDSKMPDREPNHGQQNHRNNNNNRSKGKKKRRK